MPRRPRIIIPGIPHHVTQRGNRQLSVFHEDSDKDFYRSLLYKYSRKYRVEVVAYVLMTNHTHDILVPPQEDSLQRMLTPLYTSYATYYNQKYKKNGRLWQGRYFSSPLSDEYLWNTIRYVELNPVRANMVENAIDYKWSSAQGHAGICHDPILTALKEWKEYSQDMRVWSDWLGQGDVLEVNQKIRRAISSNLPCGDTKFVDKLLSERK